MNRLSNLFIFGLCYEGIPRFNSKPLFSEKLGVVIIFGVLEAVSVFMFVFNMWKSMDKVSK